MLGLCAAVRSHEDAERHALSRKGRILHASCFLISGVTAAEASKEKLEWKDVFELTEWFRPGTLQKQAGFDPNAM